MFDGADHFFLFIIHDPGESGVHCDHPFSKFINFMLLLKEYCSRNLIFAVLHIQIEQLVSLKAWI